MFEKWGQTKISIHLQLIFEVRLLYRNRIIRLRFSNVFYDKRNNVCPAVGQRYRPSCFCLTCQKGGRREDSLNLVLIGLSRCLHLVQVHFKH